MSVLNSPRQTSNLGSPKAASNLGSPTMEAPVALIVDDIDLEKAAAAQEVKTPAAANTISATEAVDRLTSLKGKAAYFMYADGAYLGFYLFAWAYTGMFLPLQLFTFIYGMSKFAATWMMHKNNRLDRDRYTTPLFKASFLHAILVCIPPLVYIIMWAAAILIVFPLGLFLFAIVEWVLFAVYMVSLLCMFVVAPAIGIYAVMKIRTQHDLGIAEIEERGSNAGPITLEHELDFVSALKEDILDKDDESDAESEADVAEAGKAGCFACLCGADSVAAGAKNKVVALDAKAKAAVKAQGMAVLKNPALQAAALKAAQAVAGNPVVQKAAKQAAIKVVKELDPATVTKMALTAAKNPAISAAAKQAVLDAAADPENAREILAAVAFDPAVQEAAIELTQDPGIKETIKQSVKDSLTDSLNEGVKNPDVI